MVLVDGAGQPAGAVLSVTEKRNVKSSIPARKEIEVWL